MYRLHTYMCWPYRRKNIHSSWKQNLWFALNGPNTPWELHPSTPPGAESLVMMNGVYDNVKTPRTWPFPPQGDLQARLMLTKCFPCCPSSCFRYFPSAVGVFLRALVQGRWNVLSMVASALSRYDNSILLSVSWFKKLWGCLGRWLSQQWACLHKWWDLG